MTAETEDKDAEIRRLSQIIERTRTVLDGTKWDSYSWRNNLVSARRTLNGLSIFGTEYRE